MKRQRRKRSTRRRGLQHIGDVLSHLLTDIEQDEPQETPVAAPRENQRVAVPATALDAQNTFSFYQPAEV